MNDLERISHQQAERSQPFSVEEQSPLRIERTMYPVVVGESLSDWENQIDNIPAASFEEAREDEMERLEAYYDAFAQLFGLDLRAVTRTRSQILNTLMSSSALFIESRFQANDQGHLDPIFFESRRTAGKYRFNANGPFVFGDITITFSVLNRIVNTGDEAYTIDYPAYSIPRNLLDEVSSWNEHSGQDLFQPLLNLCSWRVHDWLHLAILYDTNSSTEIFQKWANDSFFVQHLVAGDGRINYELLANYLHFHVWQQLFENHPELLTEVLDNAELLLTQLKGFEAMLLANGVPAEKAHTHTMALGYLGIRSLADILPLASHAAVTRLSQYPLFGEIYNSIQGDSKKFLEFTYQDDLELPFRTGSDEKLPIIVILREYVVGLTAERQKHILDSQRTELINSHIPPFEIAARVPDSIRAKIVANKLPFETYPLYVQKMMGQCPEALSSEVEKGIWQALVERVEIDNQGFWYLQLEQDEVDFETASTAVQQKSAVVCQVPFDSPVIKLDIQRQHTLLSSHQEATADAQPGEVIIFNCRDAVLAKKLLAESVVDGAVDPRVLVGKLTQLYQQHKIEVADIYPMNLDKAINTFDLRPKNMVHSSENGEVIRPGYYRTAPNLRKVLQSGPISINSGRADEQRRKILQGYVVQNHLQQPGMPDVFPVHGTSFSRNYQYDKTAIGELKLNPTARERLGFPNATAEQLDRVVSLFFDHLKEINTPVQLGPRGKPDKVLLFTK